MFLFNKMRLAILNMAIISLSYSSISVAEIVLNQPLPQAENQQEQADLLADAYKLYKERKYQEAFMIFDHYAEQGNYSAMLASSYLINSGKVASKDRTKAKSYLNELAKKGISRAYYLQALAESQNNPKQQLSFPAMGLLNKAAGLGDSVAANTLANQHYRRNVFDKAISWNQKAIELGSSSAKKNRAIIDVAGKNKIENTSITAKQEYLSRLFEESRTGDGDASFELATRFHKGVDVNVDFGRALSFYQIAAEQGNKSAQKIVPILLSKQRSKNKLNSLWLQETASLVPTPSVIVNSNQSDNKTIGAKTNKVNLEEDDPLENLFEF